MEFQGKEVVISRHAAEMADFRRIVSPDQIEETILHGKLSRFGKHLLKFVRRNREGCIICICEEFKGKIMVKTIERGN